jgi:hypothetical protein
MTFTELAPAASDLPEPFTGRLRLAVAAYLARFKGSSRAHTESDPPKCGVLTSYRDRSNSNSFNLKSTVTRKRLFLHQYVLLEAEFWPGQCWYSRDVDLMRTWIRVGAPCHYGLAHNARPCRENGRGYTVRDTHSTE